MNSDPQPCKRCGKTVLRTPSGHTRGHSCPHGRICQPSYIARRRGVKRQPCEHCFAGRQTTLFE